jgi:uncharacterized delta-60 repeat protein
MGYLFDMLAGGRGEPRRRTASAVRNRHHKFSHPAAPLERLEDRLLFNTGLDPSFGSGGTSRIDVADLADYAAAVQALPDGRILVAGCATFGLTADLQAVQRAFVARLTPSGSLDATFGTNGIATESADAPAVTAVAALLVSADGWIYVGGSAPAATGSADPAFAVAAFTSAGAPDAGFGQAGVALANLEDQSAVADSAEWVQALARQPDGKLVAAGRIGTHADGGTRLGVVRFDAAGRVDPAYAPAVLQLTSGSVRPAADLALQPDGKVVVAEHRGSANSSFGVARFNPDGSPDASFGASGRRADQLQTGIDEDWLPPGPEPMCDLLLQPDGRLVVAGRATSGQLGLIRYDPDGTIDSSFGGGDGSVVATLGAMRDVEVTCDTADGSLRVGTVCALPPQSPGLATVPTLPSLPPRIYACTARFSAAGAWLASSRVTVPMPGDTDLFSVTLQPDGMLLAAGLTHPTVNAGEGASWEQTADALVVRFDPAGFTPDTADPTAAPSMGSGLPGIGLVVHGQPPPPSGTGTTGETITPPTPLSADPPPAFSGKATITRGRVYKFNLGYASRQLATSTAIGVYGPAGLVGAAQLVKVRGAKAKTPLTTAARTLASYRVAAPGGKFDSGDNGAYVVRVGTASAPPLGQQVGQFTVASKARPQGTQFRRLLVTGSAPVVEATVPESATALLREQAPPFGGGWENVSSPDRATFRMFVVTSIREAAAP